MNEQIYRRSMGLTYDSDLLAREVANGVGSSEPLEAEMTGFSMEDGSDLYEGEFEVSHAHDPRLRELQLEIGTYMMLPEHDELESAHLALLSAEQIVLIEEKRLDELSEEFPEAAELLQEKLFAKLHEMESAGKPVDDQMYVEAEILAEMIANANEALNTPEVLAIAEEMLALINARQKKAEVEALVLAA